MHANDSWGLAKLGNLLTHVVVARDLLAFLLLAACATTALAAMAVPFSPALERFLVARHQLAAGTVGHLIALPYPSMYSFEHHCHVSVMGFPAAHSSPGGRGAGGECGSQGVWVPINHFPGRWAYGFAGVAERCGTPQVFVELRSRGMFGEYVHRGVITVTDPHAHRWQVVP